MDNFRQYSIKLYNQHQYNTYCGLSTNTRIQGQLEKFWHIEELKQPQHYSQEEIQCEEHFVTTHSRNTDGRFVIQLPLKDGIQDIGESYGIAESRLKALERKLEKQPELKQQYYEFMREYLNLDHMSEVPADRINDKPAYYIPHHSVIKEDSTTIKLRVVFDASCKTSSGRSLNDFLKVGRNLQEDLPNIVTRLRQHPYAESADVVKIYRQIRVDKGHRKLQRILWRWSRDEPIRTYELNTVSYGMSSSSSIAIRSMLETAHQSKERYPLACTVILKDFYVDDLLTGHDSVEGLKDLKEDIISVLSSAKFELPKWKSNATEISDSSHNEVTVKLGETTKILGLWWNTATDTFHYRVKIDHERERITKRNILSRIAEIYDPLGWIGPLVVRAKIILQRLWQMNKDWDEDITGETCTMWIHWKAQIKLIENISIPRRALCDNPVWIELHGFCDASEAAYGACIYLRSVNSEGRYTVRLLCAKSRTAPIKKITLQRLELCAATLLTHLCQKVSQALTIQLKNTYYWCDSTIALSWISSEANKWHTFVANRVAEINRITCGASWHHIKSGDNPADLLSRGISSEKMESMKLWWEGPDFLHHNSPLHAFKPANIQDVPEARVITLIATAEQTDSHLIQKFSSLTKLKHTIAYCLRFRNIVKDPKTGPLSLQELDKALISAIKMCQASEFHQELRDFRDQKQLNSKSKILNLHPFLDSESIIRVGGRLRHAPIEYSRKYPIILPK